MSEARTYVLPTTRAQREAVLKLFRRDFPSWSPTFRIDHRGERVKVPTIQYRRFRKMFRPCYGGFIGGMWKGMFLGIERDGYTHS